MARVSTMSIRRSKYDPKQGHKPYPVLYLLHGWSDMANGWTEVGQANFIFDNLIAEGKAAPMLVVMPLGYGDMKFVSSGEGVWNDAAWSTTMFPCSARHC